MSGAAWQKVLLTGLASVGLSSVACAGGPFPYTRAWYAERACDPPGARQVESHGKLWPPYPRPVGRKATAAHTYHYAHYWPHPHNCEDQSYMRNLLDLQAAGGWVTATTLHDYHFNADTQQLTDGGRNHLLWVAQTVPAQHRTVYVAQGGTAEVGQSRVELAEQFYRESGIVNPPVILARFDSFEGRPAVEVDRIRQLELQSIPRPRLFYIGAATAGAGAGGGVPGGAGGPTGGAGSTTTANPTNGPSR
ncbi:hypothetical protein [Schlesneria paludicola]|uniref:hypothetical protein n=1 Tax=Schlesneria paludicola TaxID=360056 RepID=UPI0012FC525A|nr:hypothetical protein [Schlesneria paludicola]